MRLWIIQRDEPHSSVKSMCVWQSLIEIKYHSISHSKCITAFRVLYWSASVRCGAHTHFIDSSDVHASVIHGSTLCRRCSLVPWSPGYKAPSDAARVRGPIRCGLVLWHSEVSLDRTVCTFSVHIYNLFSGIYMFCTVRNKTGSLGMSHTVRRRFRD